MFSSSADVDSVYVQFGLDGCNRLHHILQSLSHSQHATMLFYTVDHIYFYCNSGKHWPI